MNSSSIKIIIKLVSVTIFSEVSFHKHIIAHESSVIFVYCYCCVIHVYVHALLY